mmetsp:Transcript_19856/g.35302  ORF Transcript_19856/g.35302 Transcript_19856/m.35302 type:complete len:286 (+) Transcript_19856:259-1116(+)
MFVKKDQRKIREILEDPEDDRKELFLARRGTEFPGGMLRSVLCRPRHVARLEVLEHLSLYGNGLKTLAGIGALGACKNLASLDVGRNDLHELPAELAQLTSLTSLVAEDNHLEKIGAGILGLVGLKNLRLSGNKIRSIPAEIASLKDLETVFLDNNLIDAVPEAFGELKALQSVNLGNNKIEQVPDSLGNLTQLSKLILSSNALTRFLPDEAIARLGALKVLLLNGNKIEHISGSLAGLGECRINLANNQIQEIPSMLQSSCKELNTFGQRPLPQGEPQDNPAEP